MRIDKNTTIKLGNRNIVKIKKGNVVIWEKSSGPVVEPDYLYIENTYDGSNTITFTTNASSTLPSSDKYSNKVEYSTDKVNWTTLTFNTSTPQTVTINSGEKLYLRNNSGMFNYYYDSNSNYGTSINASQSCILGGNANTLLDYNNADNLSLTGKDGCFYNLFRQQSGSSHITDASSLVLPATTLAQSCYAHMFYECNSLTTAPALPAMNLPNYCYGNMFYNCTSLTTAPALPATTLGNYCYQGMFTYCSSLTSAPAVLPAITLTERCYNSMFSNCSSLTTVPALPATTLADYCYNEMFSGCTSLVNAPALPATTLASGCYYLMFNGCRSLTTAPALPATTLASECYYRMFTYCSSLTSAPALPATTLASNCYFSMFYGCSSLNKILVYANSGTTSGKINGWLNGVAASGTFYNAGGETYTQDSASGIPTGWTEVTTVPTTSVYAVPDTFTTKSWNDTAKLNYFIMGVNETGIDVPLSSETVSQQIGKNTGSSTRTITQTYSYDGMDYTITINQTANDTDEPNYFYIESLGDGNTVSVVNEGNDNTDIVTPTIEYSTDRNTWTTITFDWTYGTHTTTLPVTLNTGDKVWFRNDTDLFSYFDNSNYDSYISFSPSVSSNVGGSLNTLVNYNGVSSSYNPGMFKCMFYNQTTIVNARRLVQSSENGSTYCYGSMFSGCTSLTTAPALPATNLAKNCYQYMFKNCSALTSAPALPATTLASNCYQNMFSGCTSLTTAPALPATTLADSCYYHMFDGCTSITTAPVLPATTLASSCYNRMFQGCTSLTSVTIYATTTTSNAFSDWLYNVAASGTVNNAGFLELPENSASGIPTGWTEVLPIQSITANPYTFTLKSYKTKVTCESTLTITSTLGTTVTKTNSAVVTVGENTGDSTRTLTETIPYKGSSYQVTIIQTANDVKPTVSWNVVSTGTYPFELNSNNYYESTNKGHNNSYSYATLNYEGFDELVLECINFAESNYDYGIISQPDVQLSQSYDDDGATGSANVFHNFKGQQSANPVQLTIPSDGGSHFITIKFRKDSSEAKNNDSLQFKVIEP